MKWKPWILPLVMGGLLSGIYFLPQSGDVAQSAVKMVLPGREGSWVLKAIPPSDRELATLAKDTEFSKAICLSPRSGEVSVEGYAVPDRIDLSIVLSGYDLNNSIHRPERCMPAQGHTILSSSDRTVKLDNGHEITVKRLLSTQMLQTADGEMKLDCITYYFFIGHDRTTQNHLDRTLIDMKDRLFFGTDQRWAYVSMSMWYGKVPWIEGMVTEEEVDGKLSEFLSRFAENQILWEQIRP
ncbi:MAG: exosortase-associated EpsI family protein [Luteolibacter sp.]